MSAPRLLVVEGNTAEGRKHHVAAGGQVASENYARLLRELWSEAVVDVCFAADAGANLPDKAGLEGYDGVAVTGSGLHVYQGGPAVDAQVQLVRAVYQAETPLFGSCWGLQVATVAAGGSVRRSPRGREIGFGRRIRLNECGGEHPLYKNKPEVFEALTVHLDEVEALPANAIVLATNDHSDVQAAEIRYNGGIAWGVQYHPEYPFAEIATILRRISASLLVEGFFLNAEEASRYAADLDALQKNPLDRRIAWKHGVNGSVTQRDQRVLELKNWIERLVKPHRSARGRG
jgi:GMP synthase (glutamine-hydrolysing)